MTRHRPILHLGGTFADHHHLPDSGLWSTLVVLGDVVWHGHCVNSATTLYAMSLCPE